MKVKLRLYDKCKYDNDRKKIGDYEYEVSGYLHVNGGSIAKQIESETDGNSIDDFHEYLVLEFKDGNTSTFRYSYCDMFRLC
jgi:hypothetical protein